MSHKNFYFIKTEMSQKHKCCQKLNITKNAMLHKRKFHNKINATPN